MRSISKIFFIHFAALCLSTVSFAHVRTMFPKDDDIILIRTALSIATIIQFPDATTVQFPIIGDQSAFRIEPVENGVTKGLSLKPLRARAKTNLYLFTDKERYNFTLVTGAESSADYIVYIRSKGQPSELKWKSIEKSASGNELKITLRRLATTKDQMVLFDLSVASINRETQIDPANLWIYQNKKSKFIESLFLASMKVPAKKSIQASLAVSKHELMMGEPLEINYRDKKTNISLVLPPEVLWK